jgi:hypothetical protein
MIKAVFWREPKHITKFKINGHADYADYGQDIVCSAVSALAIAIINGMTEIVKAPVDCVISEGNIDCDLEKTRLDEKVQVLAQTLLLGLEEIQVIYPDSIKIEIITK